MHRSKKRIHSKTWLGVSIRLVTNIGCNGRIGDSVYAQRRQNFCGNNLKIPSTWFWGKFSVVAFSLDWAKSSVGLSSSIWGKFLVGSVSTDFAQGWLGWILLEFCRLEASKQARFFSSNWSAKSGSIICIRAMKAGGSPEQKIVFRTHIVLYHFWKGE